MDASVCTALARRHGLQHVDAGGAAGGHDRRSDPGERRDRGDDGELPDRHRQRVEAFVRRAP